MCAQDTSRVALHLSSLNNHGEECRGDIITDQNRKKKKKKKDYWLIVCMLSGTIHNVPTERARERDQVSRFISTHFVLCPHHLAQSALRRRISYFLISTRHMQLWFMKSPPHPSTFVWSHLSLRSFIFIRTTFLTFPDAWKGFAEHAYSSILHSIKVI